MTIVRVIAKQRKSINGANSDSIVLCLEVPLMRMCGGCALHACARAIVYI